jgi:hypothetical protein
VDRVVAALLLLDDTIRVDAPATILQLQQLVNSIFFWNSFFFSSFPPLKFETPELTGDHAGDADGRSGQPGPEGGCIDINLRADEVHVGGGY